MVRKYLKLTLGALILSLTGCGSVFGPVSQREIVSYEITDSSIGMPENCPVKTKQDILYVSPMRANAPYDTTKMFYAEKEYQLNTYSYSQWAAIPTDMLSQTIEKKLVTSCLYKNIVRNNVLADANYRLITQLIALRQNVNSQDSATNQLIIFVQLMDLDSNKVVASKIFNEQNTSAVGPQAMVVGVNQLTSKFDSDLVEWLRKNP